MAYKFNLNCSMLFMWYFLNVCLYSSHICNQQPQMQRRFWRERRWWWQPALGRQIPALLAANLSCVHWMKLARLGSLLFFFFFFSCSFLLGSSARNVMNGGHVQNHYHQIQAPSSTSLLSCCFPTRHLHCHQMQYQQTS